MNSSFDIIQLVKTLRQRKRSLEEVGSAQEALELGMTPEEIERALKDFRARSAQLEGSFTSAATTEGSEGLLVAKLVITAEKLGEELRGLRADLAQRYPETAPSLELFGELEAEQLKVARLEIELSRTSRATSEALSTPSSIATASATSASEESPYLSPGCLLRGRYKVAKVLGRGGTGAVYGVTDQRTPQVWALKELWSDNPSFDNEQIRHQLSAELRVLSSLRHPKGADRSPGKYLFESMQELA